MATAQAKDYYYRDIKIIQKENKDQTYYEIPKLKYKTDNYTNAKVNINAYYFIQATGISDKKLIDIYITADTNNDGDLQWEELETFQKKLVKQYKYLDNEPVLRPDQFIRAGGGDCDDWSVMTAGLLRFYGAEPYIARYGRTKVIGHAICLLKVAPDNCPEKYMSYEISGFHNIPAGTYIPIDYDEVGGLSGVDRRWKISDIYIPENIYGEIR
jgi:hypothetical protein